MTTITLLDCGAPSQVEAAAIGDSDVVLGALALRQATGWELKPEGLCRDDVCYPVPPGASLQTADGVSLSAVARLLGRPLIVDRDEGAASLGAAAADRGAALTAGEAPDFALPDLSGAIHRLSDFRGRKIFLLAWASW